MPSDTATLDRLHEMVAQLTEDAYDGSEVANYRDMTKTPVMLLRSVLT